MEKRTKKKFDWKYWLTILIAIVGILVSFFIGKSSVINGDYAELKNEYNNLYENCTINRGGDGGSISFNTSEGVLNIGPGNYVAGNGGNTYG